jgi:hypothetical protein
MGWLGLLRLALRAAAAIAGAVRERQLMDAGAQRETARALAEIARRLDLGRAIEAEVAAMSDERQAEEWAKP